MSPVTLRYEAQPDPIAAVFATEAEALAQAAHDLGQPGQRNPIDIWDGDRSEDHIELARVPALQKRAGELRSKLRQVKADSPEHAQATAELDSTMERLKVGEPTVLHSAKKVGALQCDCVGCTFQREAPKLPNGDARAELLERLERARA